MNPAGCRRTPHTPYNSFPAVSLKGKPAQYAQTALAQYSLGSLNVSLRQYVMPDLKTVMRKALPPAYFLLAILLSFGLHFTLPIRKILTYPWQLLGLLPLVGGILIGLWADYGFKKHNTPVNHFAKATVLVSTGAFRISRNPMYLGMTLILSGISFLLGSLSSFIPVLLFPIVLHYLFVVPEEQALSEIYGKTFDEYRDHVRRWI